MVELPIVYENVYIKDFQRKKGNVFMKGICYKIKDTTLEMMGKNLFEFDHVKIQSFGPNGGINMRPSKKDVFHDESLMKYIRKVNTSQTENKNELQKKLNKYKNVT